MKVLKSLFFAVLFITACEQEASFDVPGGHTKLFAFSEITTNEKIRVEVNVAPGINTDDSIEFPKQSDASVVLYENGAALIEPQFRFISKEKSFVSQGGFTPKAGVEYTLEVSLKEHNSIQNISATTIIPKAEYLEDINVKSLEELRVNSDQKEFSLEVDVELPKVDHNYYVLIPYCISSEGKKEPLNVKEVLKGSKATKVSKVMNGILINKKKLESKISLLLVNNSYVDIEVDLFDKIYFELRTITKEAHSYYKTLKRQVDSQNAVVSEPVITFSNFDNGLGLFSGFASSTVRLRF